MSLPRQLALRRPSESSLDQTSLYNHQTQGAVHWKELNTRSPHTWSSLARFHLFSDFLEDTKSRWCCLHLPKEGRTAAVDWALSGESCANLFEEDEKGSELLRHQHHQYLPDLSPALWLQSSDFRCEWKMLCLKGN